MNNFIEKIKNLLSAIFGVNEILFIAGFGALFHGLRGLWSLDGAFVVCGGLLTVISISGVMYANKRVE